MVTPPITAAASQCFLPVVAGNPLDEDVAAAAGVPGLDVDVVLVNNWGSHSTPTADMQCKNTHTARSVVGVSGWSIWYYRDTEL